MKGFSFNLGLAHNGVFLPARTAAFASTLDDITCGASGIEDFDGVFASTLDDASCAFSGNANFTPAKFSAFTEFWIQPDQSSTVTLTSGKVSAIVDVNGTGRGFSQGTTANRPVINTADAAFNGKDTLALAGGTGGNTWLLNGPDMSSMTQGEGWIVGKASADPPVSSFNSGWWGFGTGSAASCGIPLITTGKVRDNFGTTTTGQVTNIDPGNFAAVFSYGVVSKANDWRSYFNFATAPFFSTVTNTVGFPASGVVLGRNNGTFGTDGTLAACIVFTQELTAQQRSNLHSYFSAHFGAP